MIVLLLIPLFINTAIYFILYTAISYSLDLKAKLLLIFVFSFLTSILVFFFNLFSFMLFDTKIVGLIIAIGILLGVLWHNRVLTKLNQVFVVAIVMIVGGYINQQAILMYLSPFD